MRNGNDGEGCGNSAGGVDSGNRYGNADDGDGCGDRGGEGDGDGSYGDGK